MRSLHLVIVCGIGVVALAPRARAQAPATTLHAPTVDYDKPFVEPVHVIHEWDGESAGDQFGWIARDIGDADGDGVHDVVISAPMRSNGGQNAGRVDVYSGRSGALLWRADGKAGDYLGMRVESAGDVDGDGVPDLVVGAWRYGTTAPSAGRVYLYSGRDGHLLRTITGRIAGETLGSDAVGIGDVDGDGAVELLVTSAWRGIHGTRSGRVHAVSSDVRDDSHRGSY